jgi:hypothetical protein
MKNWFKKYWRHAAATVVIGAYFCVKQFFPIALPVATPAANMAIDAIEPTNSVTVSPSDTPMDECVQVHSIWEGK